MLFSWVFTYLISVTVALDEAIQFEGLSNINSTLDNYHGLYRPRVHFSPPKGFMNDPNGLFIDSKGLWHLYYQFNPFATIAGSQHWGHATSTDLYHWTNQPIAIYPSNNTEGIFSGSIVVDRNNTSGFFSNQTNGVVAIYTINGPIEEVVALSYSYDDGFTFQKYSGNPVLSVGSNQFRDPKVIWHSESSKWVMVIAFAQEFTVGIYTSQNLQNWTFASNFSHHGLLGLQWECPNMVQMPMVNASQPIWLLYVSIQPGAPLGGSVGQYFPGHFNGTHFIPVDNVARIADFGKDNYAGQFFFGIPGNQNQVSIAWASNWQYTNYVPTGPTEGWQSAMSLPRVNYLKNSTRIGYDLVSMPYSLRAVQGDQLGGNSSLGNGSLLVDFGEDGSSGAILLEVNITNLNASALSNTASVNLTIMSSDSGESLTAGQFLQSDAPFYMDRGNTYGFLNPYFTDKVSTALVLSDHFDMQVVVDRSVWEIFLLGGEKSATMTYYSESLLDTVIVKCGGLNSGARVSVAVWELYNTWATQNNSTEMIRSNRTSVVRRNRLGYQKSCV